MSRPAIIEYFIGLIGLYRTAKKSEKTKLLDQAVAITGKSRRTIERYLATEPAKLQVAIKIQGRGRHPLRDGSSAAARSEDLEGDGDGIVGKDVRGASGLASLRRGFYPRTSDDDRRSESASFARSDQYAGPLRYAAWVHTGRYRGPLWRLRRGPIFKFTHGDGPLFGLDG